MEHVMVDLETLGRRAGCAILSIGAVAFDPIKRQLGPEFYAVVNRASCQRVGLHEDEETLAWWQLQSLPAKQVLREAESVKRSAPLEEELAQFSDYLSQFGRDRVKVWGNGADFDNAILASCYAAVGQTLPWNFWNNRCYRTAKSLKPMIKLNRVGTYHNALDDAKSQALHLIDLNLLR